MDQVVTRRELLERLGRRYGPIEPVPGDPTAPAQRFALKDGTVFGVIASTSQPFCRTCDRSRLTADGTWYLCLYAAEGVDVRAWLRDGLSDDEIVDRIARVWKGRRDRGAEERLLLQDRQVLYPLESLRADPRREMHTRGG